MSLKSGMALCMLAREEVIKNLLNLFQPRFSDDEKIEIILDHLLTFDLQNKEYL